MQEPKRNNTEYLDFVESKFSECFSIKGYFMEQPVEITSKIDSTIDFIGSSISPLKKYIINGNIPEEGIYILQNSMKSKNLKHMKDNFHQKFGCYYKCMGTLTQPNIEKCTYDLFDYLINYLKIKREDIRIRINFEDTDLIKAIEKNDFGIIKEYDPYSHYKHKYGMDDEKIIGRDFNIGIRKKNTNEFINSAAFVLMESPKGPIGIDMAFGNCTFSMCKFGYESTIASSRMGDLVDIDSVEKEKFADALIAVSILLKEDVINHPSKHFKNKFKRYLNILLYWSQKYNYIEEELIDIIINFLNLEYNYSFDDHEKEWVKILKKER